MKKLLAAALLTVAGTALAADPVLMTGAGATFPAPLYTKWFSEYNKLHPDQQFNYQAIGSGGGIQQITKGTVDFGASDAPMSDEELQKAPGTVNIPTVLGAVVLTFNAPVTELKLTPEALSGLFLGKITKWNDPALAKANPGVKLPDLAVTIVHRSDGSGTTAIFTDYLAKVSPEWKQQVGAGKSVKWPTGLGAKGNDGVAGQVKQTPGALGYVELAYANQTKQPTAALRNKDGQFVKPSIESTSAAAAGVTVPADFRVSITDASGKNSYPIASFTYLLVPQDQKDPVKGAAMLRFIDWALHDGQKMAGPLDYAPLPAPVVAKVQAKLRTMTVQGKPVPFASSK
ncbi:phosphate ABC transporter substrate-binding protein PstS [Aggregicoccus sp. 17bor-14]|uniref:phosphate ABC transporter substrate-binding protein PstS n=1 Tax=Myxococcaceae TaxID=31 RepID=UPI00129C6875|nr:MULTISPECIES: phosphate ABC transporter substrate-binding protein PstS [Myxococcaceae]MBF5046378.1 phosphate ABC transporter substrate-binding protein PstS [Simulacricoccus sp. 17bor-14]MRI92098.1 phosphate ABC transporter substrate-binding protein PstS [Aggregicoccus sp. 17bor-14]